MLTPKYPEDEFFTTVCVGYIGGLRTGGMKFCDTAAESSPIYFN
jgi:hypothetical protein